MATSLEVVIDAVDAEAVASFWSQALPAEVLYRRPPYVVLGLENGTRILIQQVAEGAERDAPGSLAVPGGVHIDLRVDEPAVTVERLVALGARVLRRVDERHRGGSAWTTLLDPWGTPFCVAPARESVPPHPSICR